MPSSVEPSKIASAKTLGDLVDLEAEQRAAVQASVHVDVVLSDYWQFCAHITTEYEDPITRAIELRPYPVDWAILRDYHDTYNAAYDNGQDFICVKGRRLLATYDPLIDWLYRASRHAILGDPVWLMAELRQTEDDAKLLIERIQRVYDRLPAPLRGEVTKRQTGEFRIGDSVLRALHAQGSAGRGESWNRVLFDEHAFQQHGMHNWHSFVAAFQRMSISTPNGDNHFKELAESQNPKIVVFDLGWEQHPERDEAWARETRERIGEKVFLVEHCRRFDVYAEAGLLSEEFHEDCVVDVVPDTRQHNWDGVSPIIVSIDPGTVAGAGSMIRYFNQYHQDIRLASFYRQGMLTEDFAALVCGYAVARWPNADWLLTGDPAALQEKSLKTRYNENSDAAVITRVASQELAGCVYDENTGALLSGSPLPFQVNRVPRGAGSRAQRHRLQLGGFKLRPGDNRRGTLIVRSENVEFLKGCRGAYKLPPNATARMQENEEPDRSMPCVHIVDADGCGLAQFIRFGGVPQVGAQAQAQEPRVRKHSTRHSISDRIRQDRGKTCPRLS